LRPNLLGHDTDKTKRLRHGFIIIGPHQALYHREDLRPGYLLRKLKRQNLNQPYSKISKILSIHTKVNQRIKQFIGKNQIRNVFKIVYRVILQQEQIDLVNQGGHMGVVFKWACFKLSAGQNELFVYLEYFVRRRDLSLGLS
jgi:hypothetical protein